MKNTINYITLAILLFFSAIQVSYAVEQTNIVRAVDTCKNANNIDCNLKDSNGEKLAESINVIESLNAVSDSTIDSKSLETTKKKIDEINANYSEDFDKLENSVYEMQTVELEHYVKQLNLIRTSKDSITDKNIKYKAVSEQIASSMRIIRDSFQIPFENILKIKADKTREVYAEHMNKEALTKKQ